MEVNSHTGQRTVYSLIPPITFNGSEQKQDHFGHVLRPPDMGDGELHSYFHGELNVKQCFEAKWNNLYTEKLLHN